MPVIPVAQHQETRQFMISTVQFSLSLWPDDWACLVLFQQQCFRKWHPGFCSEQIQTLCGFSEGERVRTSQLCWVTEHQAEFSLFFLARGQFWGEENPKQPHSKNHALHYPSCLLLAGMRGLATTKGTGLWEHLLCHKVCHRVSG